MRRIGQKGRNSLKLKETRKVGSVNEVSWRMITYISSQLSGSIRRTRVISTIWHYSMYEGHTEIGYTEKPLPRHIKISEVSLTSVKKHLSENEAIKFHILASKSKEFKKLLNNDTEPK